MRGDVLKQGIASRLAIDFVDSGAEDDEFSKRRIPNTLLEQRQHRRQLAHRQVIDQVLVFHVDESWALIEGGS